MRSCHILFPTLLVAADFVSAACTRDELKALSDSFVESGIKKSKFELAPDAKIVQDNKILASLDQSVIANITANLKPNFRLEVLDEEECQAAATVFVQQGAGPAPTIESPQAGAILSYRLKLPGTGSRPTEVEILNSVSTGLVFRPFDYPETTPEFWTTSAPGTFTRQQLIDIVQTYPNGIEDKCGTCVKSTESCNRIENGWKIPVSCNAQFEKMGFPVYGRKYVVDTTLNTVVATWFFAGGGSGGLFTHEYFSINKDGLIQQVQANLMGMAGTPDDAWGGKKPTSSWKSSKDDEW